MEPWKTLLPRIPEHLREPAQQISPRRVEVALDCMERRLNGLVVVAEAVRRRHNVSAILRSAEAFGVHEAHLVTNNFRPSPGAARGAERWLDLRIQPDTETCLRELKERGYKIYVADLADDSYAPADLPVDQPLALLFGGELAGVSETARAMADGVVTIPMRGVTQSLNVSVAAAVTLNVVCERRRQVPGAVGLSEEERAVVLKKFFEKEHGRIKSGWRYYTE